MRKEGRSIAVADKITKYSHSQQELKCLCGKYMMYQFVMLLDDTRQCQPLTLNLVAPTTMGARINP